MPRHIRIVSGPGVDSQKLSPGTEPRALTVYMRCFLLIAATACSLYAQGAADTPSGCAVVGVVFDVDVGRHALMLKDKTGLTAAIDLPAQVAIQKMAVGGATSGRIGFEDIQERDLVCIEGNAA